MKWSEVIDEESETERTKKNWIPWAIRAIELQTDYVSYKIASDASV